MTRNFIDLAAPNRNGKSSLPFDQLPHGLVLPPSEIREIVEKEKARLGENYTPAYEKSTLDDLTLAYYYEGISVAFRPVHQGVEVLAVGDEEIGSYYRNTPKKEHQGVIVEQP